MSNEYTKVEQDQERNGIMEKLERKIFIVMIDMKVKCCNKIIRKDTIVQEGRQIGQNTRFILDGNEFHKVKISTLHRCCKEIC
jgi:hypothetical protein